MLANFFYGVGAGLALSLFGVGLYQLGVVTRPFLELLALAMSP